eukprot:scaffold11530_cov21-Tisochrysis_lutea.AAC.3
MPLPAKNKHLIAGLVSIGHMAEREGRGAMKTHATLVSHSARPCYHFLPTHAPRPHGREDRKRRTKTFGKGACNPYK